MNIIIPLAGKSQRFKKSGFKKDKFLLKIGEQSIIEKVISMFDANKDNFFFIISNKQNKKEIENHLNNLVKKKSIIVINENSLGPVKSILLASKKIPNNQEVIISYCDFYVDWDYEFFKRNLHNVEANFPAFKGFHPASFGNTYYAYMKLDKDNFLLKLREKKSFTNKRSLEPASTGLYYFKSFKIFLKYSKLLVESKKLVNNEYYVSLLANLMIADNLKIKVDFIKKFICLGTPEDYKEYLYWLDYFSKNKQRLKGNQTNSTNLIPLGGVGNRFKKAGYKISKPFIRLDDETIIEKSCKSFPVSNNWIFIINKSILKNKKNYDIIYSINKNSKIKKIDSTNGQLETCYLAKNNIDKNKNIFVASCDYISIFDEKKWSKFQNLYKPDVVVWTFKLKDLKIKNYSNFAYCKLNNKKKLTSIVEKKTISKYPQNDQMVVGSFWFKNFSLIEDCYKNSKNKSLKINNEYYIGESINFLIKKGKNVLNFEIDKWISLGDPFELNMYYYWKDYFYDKN